jgi:hypothetical protein
MLDVSGDDLLTPRDALRIINYLSDSGSGEGEGEGEAQSTRVLPSLRRTDGHSIRAFWDGLAIRPAVAAVASPLAEPEFAVEAGLYAEATMRDRAVRLVAFVEPYRPRRTRLDALEANDEEVFRNWPDERTAMWLRF